MERNKILWLPIIIKKVKIKVVGKKYTILYIDFDCDIYIWIDMNKNEFDEICNILEDNS